MAYRYRRMPPRIGRSRFMLRLWVRVPALKFLRLLDLLIRFLRGMRCCPLFKYRARTNCTRVGRRV